MIPTLHFRWNLVLKPGQANLYDATLQQLFVDNKHFANVELESIEEMIRLEAIGYAWRDIPKNYVHEPTAHFAHYGSDVPPKEKTT